MPSLTTKATVTVRPRVDRLVKEKLDIRTRIADLEKLSKEIDATLLEELDKADGALETSDWKAVIVESESRNVKKELLLELGVKPSIIAKATAVVPYRYPKITVKKT